jgi:TonB-dependent receptor
MKCNISKIFISIITTFSFILLCTSAVSKEAKQDGMIVNESVDEVIVFGIRKSLETALEQKREMSNLTEVINADDVGKLPDENIAEVLENLPGVQIDRSAGIGSSVSVRGSSQNRVEINGRSTTPAEDARGGISFSDLPSTLVRSLNVVKVPTADMVEGSLGGTVNVKTYRGLRLKKPLKVVRVNSEYAQNADKWNEKYSGTFGDKFSREWGDFGVIMNISHMDKFVREDVLRVSPGARYASDGQYDHDGDGEYDAYYRPGYSLLDYGMRNITNTAFSGSLEWQVEDDLKLYTQGSYTDVFLQNFGQQSSAGVNGSDLEMDDPNRTYRTVEVAGLQVPMLESGIIGGGIRNGWSDTETDTGLPDDGLRIRSNNLSGGRDTQSYVSALGGEWDKDSLNIVFEVSAAGSDTEKVDLKTIFQFNNPNSVDGSGNPNFHSAQAARLVPYYYNINGDILEYGPVAGEVSDQDFLDPNNWALYQNKIIDVIYKNKEVAQKIDATWFTDHDFITSIKAGVRFTQRLSERNKQSQLTGNYPELSAADFEGYLSATPGDFFSFHESGNYLDNFITVDPELGLTHRDAIAELVSQETEIIVDPLQGFAVDEDTAATYVRADFDFSSSGIPVRGAIGLRDILTKQVANGAERISTINDDGEVEIVETQATTTQKYSNTLPSASLVFAPIEKLQFRFGYAQVMRRPNFRDLSPTIDYPLSAEIPVRVGNVDLVPTTGEQFDLGLEYYFRKGSVASIGLYKKNLKDNISNEQKFNNVCNPKLEWTDSLPAWRNCNPGIKVNSLTPQQTFDVTVIDPITGEQVVVETSDRGYIKGVELSFLHYFRNLPRKFRGLGVIASYAYQDGERTKTFKTPQFLRESGEYELFPLNFTRLSENSYNLTVFIERHRFNARLRYTYRDNFLLSSASDITNTLPIYTADRGQLNGSMSYKISKTTTVTLSGVNLLKSRKTNPGVFAEGPIAQMSDSDRRISLGLRAKF